MDITATADWVAAVVEPVGDAENMWLTLSKDSGTGNDELRLFVTENTDGAKRTGKVKITMAGAGAALEQEISVEQLVPILTFCLNLPPNLSLSGERKWSLSRFQCRVGNEYR